MTKNKRGYIVPDAYTACVLLVTYDKASDEMKVVMSKRGALDKSGQYDPFDGKWAIPEHYVEYGQMANETAMEIIQSQMKLDTPSMFVRHIGVFDSPNRDTRGWYIANLFYAVVSYDSLENLADDFEIVNKEDLLNDETKIAFDHKSLARKVLDNVENDVYTQIFNKTLFESDIISELLGKQFSAGDLQSLGDYVGLTYDRTTYYRNINKFYTKCGSIKVDGIKKPVTLYQKGEVNE
ncbi:hypothetical protein RZE82_00425 [Mollicutes bacterium LVI A0039]|nr:hypothetical protein RZE82_00425 [Mollicutes bacterium LVI A0039]